MPLNRHHCIFYERAEDLWALCIPLIHDNARSGFKWLYVADDHDGPNVQSALTARLQSPVPAGEVVSARSLLFLDTPVSVNAIISQLRARAQNALDEGFSGLFLLVEMTWSLRTPFGVAYLTEYEARLHELLSGMPLRTSCLYNRRVITEAMILDALRTHPGVYAADGLHGNPHFLPPAALLGGDSQAQLQYWMKAISPALADSWYPSSDVPEPGYTASLPHPANAVLKPPIYNLEPPAPLVATGVGQQRWKIHCLGELQVYRQDGSPVRWNAANGATLKTKTLFAYLLQCGRKGATAEELADLLWPEANSTGQSLNRLYHTVHCLRMALSPELQSSRDSPFVLNDDQHYFLALPAGVWIDIPVFEQLCYKAERLLREGDDAESLTCHLAAESLYRGLLLADIPPHYAENMDNDWCWSRRYWLREMYLKMLTYMAGIYRRNDDVPRALAYCEKVLSIDPCSERAHQEMMRIFHLARRRDALERQYRLCTQALERYDSRAPAPATQALYQSLIDTL
ncbi:MAG: MEDS domain-containing protein [Chloroflexi bacterium]|nr:MEDS domain-containing protein [Chloroflexota bacterium]MBI5828146.1 MEDS domain-containing protein [Chloroflexota bacterium]